MQGLDLNLDSKNEVYLDRPSFQSPEEWLRGKYLQKIQINPRFSIRAFSKQLAISVGALSELMSGKRRLSRTLANRIIERLEVDNIERAWLDEHLGRDNGKRSGAVGKIKSSAEYHILNEEAFELVANWKHFAILSLIETKDFKSDEDWIAKRLFMNKVEVVGMLRRLERAGLIEKNKGTYKVTHSSTGMYFPTSALRQSLKDKLLYAAKGLDAIPPELRDVTSITMAIDPKKIDQAREVIKEFRRSLCEFLEKDEKTEVYQLNIQLIPVSSRESI